MCKKFSESLIIILVLLLIEINAIEEDFNRAELLEVEREFQNNLSQYVVELKEKLLNIRLGLKEMRRFNVEGDVEAHLSNPLSSFALLRHMHADWPKWLKLMRTRVGEKQISFFQNALPKTTNRKDLKDATKAIIRIQKSYSLDAKDIASGLLDGRQHDATLNALDCFEIGLVQYSEQWYNEASQWFQLVLDKYHDGDSRVSEMMGLSLTDTCLIQAKLFLRRKMQAQAMLFVDRALELQPENNKLLHLKSELMTNTFKSIKLPASFTRPQMQFEDFDKACGLKFKRLSRLHCVYLTTSTPLLKLAPFKLEELSLDPYIVIYHNVLYDSEIENLKAEATPYLKPALTTNLTHDNIISEIRTAEAVWLDEWHSPTSITVNQRMIDMTNFIIDDSETIQVIRYGVGGHFNAHVDYFDDEGSRPDNDRLATVLFYMTDVTQGGGTMFPYLDLIVYPTKGSALLWHNLDNAGYGHTYTLHAACPVIVGSKWGK